MPREFPYRFYWPAPDGWTDDDYFAFAVRFSQTPTEAEHRLLGTAFGSLYDREDAVLPGGFFWDGERYGLYTTFINDLLPDRPPARDAISAATRFVATIHRLAAIDEAVFLGGEGFDDRSEHHAWSVAQQPKPDPGHIPHDNHERARPDPIFQAAFEAALREKEEDGGLED